MARRRQTRRSAARRPSRSYNRRVSRPAKRRVQRRASAPRSQTVRIELITTTGPSVGRPDEGRLKVEDKRPKKAMF